jgi:hypothetical protein
LQKGLVHFEDSSKLLYLLKQIDKSTILWGPEAKTVFNVWRREWNKSPAPEMLSQWKGAFDLSGDISVDGSAARQAVDAIDWNMMRAVMDEAMPGITKAMGTAGKRSGIYFEDQRETMLEKQDEAIMANIALAMSDQLEIFALEFPQRRLHPESERLIQLAQTNPAQRGIDKLALKTRIKAFTERYPMSYLEQISDVHVGRTWNFTGLQVAVRNEVRVGQIIAHRDELLCPVCMRLDGRTFQVAAAVERMEGLLDAEPSADALSQASPFPRVPDIDNKSPAEIEAMGLLPPFHGRCRCEIVYAWR